MRDTAYTNSIYAKYLGTLSVLGRVIQGQDLSTDDQYSVDAAFADANGVLAAKKAGVRFCRTSTGGWSTFEHKEAA